VRRFSPEYLRRTREGLWDRSTAALAPLSLPDRERVLDAGAGTGEFAHVLAADTPATVVCLDADPDLLDVARERTGLDVVAGDATRPPFAAGAFDLVACQALLVNLPDPAAALDAFAAVSSELVAAVEPDNADVSVDSTVDAEAGLERRARTAYIEGVGTDVAMGARLPALFRDAGFESVPTRRHYHR
jgi:SAM-dependent methyltransferase